MKTRNDSQLSFNDRTFMGESYYDILVPQDHFLRTLHKVVDLSRVMPLCASVYKNSGRPPEDPERMFRMLLVMFLYQIHSETELIRQTQVNMAYKWFCGFKITEPLPDHSLFYVFRNRSGPVIFEQIFASIIRQCIDNNLLSPERIYIDSTDMKDAATDYTPYEQALLLARAMLKKIEQGSLEPTDSSYQPPKKADEQSKRFIAEVAVEFTRAKRVNPEKFLEKLNALDDDTTAPANTQDKVSEPATTISKSALKQLAEQTFPEIPHAKGDKDSRAGHTSNRESFTGYLPTICIGDEQAAFITSIEVAAGNAYAADNFSSVYRQHKEHTQQTPAVVTCDSAFDQPGVHTLLEQDKAIGYIRARKFTNTTLLKNIFVPDYF